jgi:hypothetical protein
MKGMGGYVCYAVYPLTFQDLLDLLQSKFKEAKFLESDKHSSHEVLVCISLNRLILVALYIIKYIAYEATTEEEI